MTTVVGDLLVLLRGDAKGLQSALAVASSSTASFAKKTTAITAGVGASMTKFVTLPVVGLGVAATKMAVDFEQSMRNVNSIMRLSEAQFASTSQQVVDLSKRFPQSADTLARGLYDIASSGFQGADAMKVLEASATAASAGLSTTATSAKAITAVLNAYGLEAKDAAHVSDVLFTAVDKGVLTFDEVASSIGHYIGAASQLALPLEQVAGAQAAMTLSGVSASEAAVSLNGILKTMLKPSTELAKVFKNMGYESGQAALESLGLVGLMEKLSAVVGEDKSKWVELFPEIRAARGAMALAAADGENLTRVMEGMNDSAGRTSDALGEQAKSAAFQFQIALNQLKAAAIELGNELIPILVEDIIPAIQSMVKWWSNLDRSTKSLIIKSAGLAAALGPVLLIVSKLTSATIGLVGAVRKAGTTFGISGASAAAWATALTLVAIAGEKVHGFLKQDEDMASVWHDEIRRGVGSLADYRRGVEEVTNENGALIDTLDGDLKVMQALDIVTAELTAKWRRFSAATGAAVEVQDAFVRIMTEAQGVTRKESQAIAAQLNAVERLTKQGLTPLLEMQVRNLLAMGDFEGAMKLLNRAIRGGIGAIKNYVNWQDTLEGRLADTAKAAYAAYQNQKLLNSATRPGGGGGGRPRNVSSGTPGTAGGTRSRTRDAAYLDRERFERDHAYSREYEGYR